MKKNIKSIILISTLATATLAITLTVFGSLSKVSNTVPVTENVNTLDINQESEDINEDWLYTSIWGTVQSINQDNDGNRLLTILEDNDGIQNTVTLKITQDTVNCSEDREMIIGSYIISQYTKSKTINDIILADDILVVDPASFQINIDPEITEVEAEIIHQGKFVELWLDPDNENCGMITIFSNNFDGDWAFNFDENTNISLDLNQLNEGDQLQILADSTATLSLPPQSYAIEISLQQ